MAENAVAAARADRYLARGSTRAIPLIGPKRQSDRQQEVKPPMSQATEQALLAALCAVKDPASGKDIVSAGLVEALHCDGGRVHLALLTDRAHAAAMEPVRAAAEAVLARQPGVDSVTAVLTGARAQPAKPEPEHAPRAPRSAAAGERPMLLPEAKAVIAVASGKGGVGKSTVAVNLAVALAQFGLKVGLLDADIYGPSLPRMLGLARKPEVVGERLIPIPAWGLVAMSIGFLVDEDTAMIWRGPMVMGALEQLMGQVAWGPLDVMVVDMPPGTGDAQLTMAQRVALAGAVVVSTPQDIALLDARRSVRMFERTSVPVLGLVENMSYFICPHCHERSEIFGYGGAKAEAARLGCDFLGEVPLQIDVRTASDAGTPIVAAAPESPAGQAFLAIAAAVRAKLPQAAGPGVRIVVEE